jgi:hypothetical protein
MGKTAEFLTLKEVVHITPLCFVELKQKNSNINSSNYLKLNVLQEARFHMILQCGLFGVHRIQKKCRQLLLFITAISTNRVFAVCELVCFYGFQ